MLESSNGDCPFLWSKQNIKLLFSENSPSLVQASEPCWRSLLQLLVPLQFDVGWLVGSDSERVLQAGEENRWGFLGSDIVNDCMQSHQFIVLCSWQNSGADVCVTHALQESLHDHLVLEEFLWVHVSLEQVIVKSESSEVPVNLLAYALMGSSACWIMFQRFCMCSVLCTTRTASFLTLARSLASVSRAARPQ